MTKLTTRQIILPFPFHHPINLLSYQFWFQLSDLIAIKKNVCKISEIFQLDEITHKWKKLYWMVLIKKRDNAWSVHDAPLKGVNNLLSWWKRGSSNNKNSRHFQGQAFSQEYRWFEINPRELDKFLAWKFQDILVRTVPCSYKKDNIHSGQKMIWWIWTRFAHTLTTKCFVKHSEWIPHS